MTIHLPRDHVLFSIFSIALALLLLTPGERLWNFWLLVLTAFLLFTITAIVRHCRRTGTVVAVITFLLLSLIAQWGVMQFVWQRGLGMYLLGESRLNYGQPGVANFSFNSTKLVRAYGPFSHPNILGGALIVAVMLAAACDSYRMVAASNLFWYPVLYGLLGGIFVTFSRSAYFACLILAAIFMVRKRVRFSYYSWLIVMVISLIIGSPFVIARIFDANDQAFAERVKGARAAVGIISSHPLWRGVGNSYLVELRDYYAWHEISYQPWEVDYVHSSPLLMAAISGLLPALFIAAALITGIAYTLRANAVWLIPMLPLLLVDHYFITHLEFLALFAISLLVLRNIAI